MYYTDIHILLEHEVFVNLLFQLFTVIKYLC